MKDRPELPTNPLPRAVASDGPQVPGRRPAPGRSVRPVDARAVPRLRGLLGLETSERAALQVVVEAAREALPDVAEASVSLSGPGSMTTVAWTGLLAQELDAAQCRLAEGPGLDAVAGGVPISIDNMRVETRWPGFVRYAWEKGALSVLAVPVPRGFAARGVFALYSTRANGLDAQARRLGVEYADLAAEVLATPRG